jgi:hypothetical protein
MVGVMLRFWLILVEECQFCRTHLEGATAWRSTGPKIYFIAAYHGIVQREKKYITDLRIGGEYQSPSETRAEISMDPTLRLRRRYFTHGDHLAFLTWL